MKKVFLLLLLLPLFSQAQIVDRFTRFGGVFVYAGNNAADPVNEVNGVANIQEETPSTFTIVSTTSHSPTNGAYCVEITRTASTGTAYDAIFQLIGVSNGDNVTVTWDAIETSGFAFSAGLHSAEGWDVTDEKSTTGSWASYSATANCDTDDPYFHVRSFSAGTPGDQIAIDNIVVTIN